jgi:hypothetical protein
MKQGICILFLMIIFHWGAVAQSSINPLNPNDISLLRVYNGVVIPNDFRITSFDRVSMIQNKEDLDALGFRPDKPILIIEFEQNDIEYKIDSVLYNRKDFISAFKFPLDIQLPLSMGTKVLTDEEKKELLPKLTLDKIKRIEYIDYRESMRANNITPFGMIDITLF